MIYPKLQSVVYRSILNIGQNIRFNNHIKYYSKIPKVEDRCSYGNSYQRSFKVEPIYGTFILESDCKCSIASLNTEEFPNLDHAFLLVKSSTIVDENCIDFRMVGDEMNRVKLKIADIPEALCEIRIPLKYNIEAIMEKDASITLENFESDHIDISTHTGAVNTKNVKTLDIYVATESGKLNFDGLLQGNVFLSGKSLVCSAKRLQGSRLQIEADQLETEIESSYMTEGNIVTQNGNINIKSLHGSTQIHVTEGNININALHGQVGAFLRKGNCDIQVTELLKDSYCEVEEGDIKLHYLKPEGNNVDLFSSILTIAPEFESLGEKVKIEDKFFFSTPEEDGKPLFKAHAKNGSLIVKIRSWFESLGIKV